jgi:hypothetical protein
MKVKIIEGIEEDIIKENSKLEKELNEFISSVENNGGEIILPISSFNKNAKTIVGSSMQGDQDIYGDQPIWGFWQYPNFIIYYKEGSKDKKKSSSILNSNPIILINYFYLKLFNEVSNERKEVKRRGN